MRQIKSIRCLLAVVLTAWVAAAQAADGASLYKACAACHGAQGEGIAAQGAPNIGGMPVWYVARQIDNFALGRRGMATDDKWGKQMRGAVAALSAADRTAVAAHVASLPNYSGGGTALAAGADLKAGATQYNAICSGCHGGSGRGNQPLAAPPLAGVDSTYLARQLAAFRLGQRGAHADDAPGRQMAAMSKTLRDAAAERNVIAYIASLKP